MLDPMTAAPALHAEAHAPAWRVVRHMQTYETQAHAHLASVAGNLEAAVAVLVEMGTNPTLLANRQVREEMDERLRFLGYHEPDMVADFRQAIAVLEADPAAQEAMAVERARHEADLAETAAQLAWIRREVAPRRDEESVAVVDLPKPGSLVEGLAAVMTLDEGGGEDTPVALADWVKEQWGGDTPDWAALGEEAPHA